MVRVLCFMLVAHTDFPYYAWQGFQIDDVLFLHWLFESQDDT